MQELDQEVNNLDLPLSEHESLANKWNWYSWQVILLILNAVFGLIAFEWAWNRTKRHREL